MNSQTRLNLSIIAIVALLALILSGVALFKTGTLGTSNSSNSSLAKILSTKRWDVCVAEWPPASIKDAKTGQYSGQDIDAYNLIAKQIGVTVVYHDTTFGNMPAAIQSGVCESGTSLFVEVSRAAAVDFSRPVLYGGVSALVMKGDTRFKSAADINKPGVRVVVATGEAGAIYAQSSLQDAKVTSVDVDSSDLSRFMLNVTSGQADIAVADSNTIQNFAAAHPDTQAIFITDPLQLSPDAFPVKAGDTELLDFLNNSLLTIQVDGEWKALQDKYNAHWLQPVTQYQIQ